MSSIMRKNYLYCGYEQASMLFWLVTSAAYCYYFLLVDDGWTTDCGAPGACVDACCPQPALHVNATGLLQSPLSSRKRQDAARHHCHHREQQHQQTAAPTQFSGFGAGTAGGRLCVSDCILLHQHAAELHFRRWAGDPFFS